MARLNRDSSSKNRELRDAMAERLRGGSGDSESDNTPEFGDRLWPVLEWRGDGKRRALTCGTILSIVSDMGGQWDDDNPGVDAATVMRELRRIAAKYDPDKDSTLADKTVRGGDMILTSARDVAETIANLCDISGVLRVSNAEVETDSNGTSSAVSALPGDSESRDDSSSEDDDSEKVASRSNGETPTGVVAYELLNGADGSVSVESRDILLKLTFRGQERLAALLSASTGDKRFAHIDFSDPILEYNPALDVATTADESSAERYERERLIDAEAAMADILTPLKRTSKTRPTYRLWMWIVKVSPQTYAYTVTDTDPDVVLTAENTAPGEPHEKCGIEMVKAMTVRPFIDLVLSGGPDGIWTGKPIQPHAIHHDVEAFTAADRAGFGDGIVQQSSMAWEMFDDTGKSTNDYLTKRIELKASYDARAQSLDILPVAKEGSDIENLNKRPQRTDRTTSFHLERENYYAKKIVFKTTADALMDALVDHGVSPDPDSMGIMDWRAMTRSAMDVDHAPKVRCGAVKTGGRQCRNWSVGGTGRCELHGGRLIDEDETRSLLRAQQIRIFAASGKALDTVLYLMENSSNDAIRLRAAETVLSRAGLSEKSEINLEVGAKDDTVIRQDPGQIVRERLARLAGFDNADVFDSPKQLEAVDAEVVDIDSGDHDRDSRD